MTDREGMAQALALASLGEGRTRPNPVVGCVVAKDGHVVGTGYHRAAGEPHAETLALTRAGAAARGATLYVNLEPCAHSGRTPPCVEAVVASGVSRVVAGLRDPNPLVNGRGIERLRAAGIDVTIGVMEDACRAINAGFLSTHERGRPWVTVKAAASLDGQIAARSGSSTWITGEPARRYAHRLRYRHDAVLVGAGTVRRDDPSLTVRLEGVATQRLRVVLASRFDLDPGAKIFQRHGSDDPRPRVYGSEHPESGALAAVADAIRVPSHDGDLDLAAVLSDLASAGVQSVLVEGGGRTIGSFLRVGLADALALFVAPCLLGARGATPLVDLQTAATPGAGRRVVVREVVPLGADRLVLADLEAI